MANQTNLASLVLSGGFRPGGIRPAHIGHSHPPYTATEKPAYPDPGHFGA